MPLLSTRVNVILSGTLQTRKMALTSVHCLALYQIYYMEDDVTASTNSWHKETCYKILLIWQVAALPSPSCHPSRLRINSSGPASPPHLTHGSPKWQLDWFSRFAQLTRVPNTSTVRQTDKQTTLRSTSVAIDCILCTACGRCGLVIIIKIIIIKTTTRINYYAWIYLVTFNFNHLLDAILDDEVTVIVIVTSITLDAANYT